jgi:hypothetical protein
VGDNPPHFFNMSVISIREVYFEKDKVTVTAVIEDAKLRYSATYFEPEEWEPALCSSTFYLDENEQLPLDEQELLDYVNDLNLDWEIVNVF